MGKDAWLLGPSCVPNWRKAVKGIRINPVGAPYTHEMKRAACPGKGSAARKTADGGVQALASRSIQAGSAKAALWTDGV